MTTNARVVRRSVDSGSSKRTWAGIPTPDAPTEEAHQQPITHYATSLGINPIRDKEESILQAVRKGTDALFQSFREEGLCNLPSHAVRRIFFYGAGCIPPYSTTVRNILHDLFPLASIQVESDMAGAALALCGHQEGIACILGTGSNSCLFDGESIVEQTPALGFILGDEGSGASLGKRLVGDVLKKQLPAELREAFFQETGLSQPEIINRVYRQPQPNMFLASLTTFLERHLDHKDVRTLVIDEFRRFLQRNIRAYQRPDLPVHFVGGITATYQEELKQALEMEGLHMGKILSRPIQGMVEYHLACK